MRIAHYYPTALQGHFGTANSVRGWCEALTGVGAEVTLVVDAEAVRLPCPPGAELRTLPHVARGRLRAPLQPQRALVGHDLVVTHGGWVLHPILAGSAARRAHMPYVTAPHGAYSTSIRERGSVLKRLWTPAFERGHISRALGVHVFFPDEHERLRELTSDVRTITVPNGVTVPVHSTWDGGSGGYLAWLGRFCVPQKGLDLLLNALSLLPVSERPVLRLHGPDWRNGKALVAQMSRSLGLDRWVVIGNPLYGDAKWELLRRAAGFVFPSRQDACSMAVTEAIAVGVPTVLTQLPFGRFLAAEHAAIACAPSPAAIAAGMQELLGTRAGELSHRAALVASTKLAWPAVARAWLDAAEKL